MRHYRAGVDDVFHGCGTDVLATSSDDDVFLASRDIHKAIIVDGSQITGLQPAIGHLDVGRQLWFLVIAKEHIRTHHLQFPIIVGPHTHTGTRLAYRTDTVGILPVDDHRCGSFRHTVALDEGNIIHTVEEMGEINVQGGSSAG